MKRWIARILAAAMAVSLLSVSAFAAEHTEFPDYFSLDFEATQVDERLSVNQLREGFTEFESGDGFYYAIADGAEFTVTNTSSAPDSFVYVAYQRYDAVDSVELYGAMEKVPTGYLLTASNEFNWYLTADGTWEAIDEGYWLLGAVMYDGGLMLSPGQSTTFTVPNSGEDAIYLIYVYYLDPAQTDPDMNDYTWAQWNYYKFEEFADIEETPAEPETPAEETPAEPTEDVVMPTNQALTVNGEAVTGAQVYNINGSNYFKLRDVAALLNGTGSQFALEYDAENRTIVLTTGQAYTPDGSELTAGEDQSGTAVRSSQPLMIDGSGASLEAFNIGGNNYFMLRALGEALGFEVDYDAASRTMIVNSK